MTTEEIKKAVDQGEVVNWLNIEYTVIKDNKNQYLIKHKNNVIGLTWADGTLNGQESDFYIGL